MYAIIQAGAHQYRVSEGESLTVDKIAGKPGDKVSFDKVHGLVDKEPEWGAAVKAAKVTGVIVDQVRGDKITVFKYKRRKNYKRTRGAHALGTVVKIEKISKK